MVAFTSTAEITINLFYDSATAAIVCYVSPYQCRRVVRLIETQQERGSDILSATMWVQALSEQLRERDQS